MKQKAKLLAIILLLTVCYRAITYDSRMDKRVRKAVVQLMGEERGSCSGEHIQVDDKVYILSAGHCRVLENKKGEILVKDDSMEAPIPRRVLQEDPYSDLLLLEALPDRDGLEIGSDNEIGKKLISFTHGAGLKTHRTEGELIDIIEIEVLLGFYNKETCNQPKQAKSELDLGFFKIPVCVLQVEEIASTMQTAPGSSGGAVVDSSGRLIAVVSAGGGGYSFLVPLAQIKKFIQNWK